MPRRPKPAGSGRDGYTSLSGFHVVREKRGAFAYEVRILAVERALRRLTLAASAVINNVGGYPEEREELAAAITAASKTLGLPKESM